MIGKTIDRDIYHRVFTSTHHRFPNGESRKDVAERMKRYLTSLDDDAIHVVFSHGVAISCTVHEIL
jgi:broad specificity phosphatase PhoE